jgi:hypothetical protein
MSAQVSAGTFHKPKPTRGISFPDAKVIVLLPIFVFGCWKALDECPRVSGQIMRIWTCLQCSGFFMQESAMIYHHRQIIGFEQRICFYCDEPRNHKSVVVATISSNSGDIPKPLGASAGASSPRNIN